MVSLRMFHLDRLEEYQICHIFGEGNRVADRLTNMGVDDESLLVFDKG